MIFVLYWSTLAEILDTRTIFRLIRFFLPSTLKFQLAFRDTSARLSEKDLNEDIKGKFSTMIING
jgi:hypothetical protein